jgi:hypothetical protein
MAQSCFDPIAHDGVARGTCYTGAYTGGRAPWHEDGAQEKRARNGHSFLLPLAAVYQ